MILDQAERTEFLELLAQWDEDSGDTWLGPIEPRLPLGHYVERLLGAWLHRSRRIRLLASNWRLCTSGTGGRRTLGEADFLVQREGQPEGGRQLWEVACKIYLGVPTGEWLGPGLNDSLDIKVSRIRDHQLPLIERPEFQEAWRGAWTARAWLSGWLMEPAQNLPAAPGAEASFVNGRIPAVWAEVGQRPVGIAHETARALGVTEWWVLPRRRWLRPVFADEPPTRCCTSIDLVLASEGGGSPAGNARGGAEGGAGGPILLAGIRRLDPGGLAVAVEVMRLMLVPAGWTLRALSRGRPAAARPVKA